MTRFVPIVACLALLVLSGCSEQASNGHGQQQRGKGPGGPPGGRGAGEPTAAVPVELAPVGRRSISAFIETNGILEAEDEVDIVARAAGPIVELRVEEGDLVAEGQVLARLDAADYRAQVEIARVTLNETELAFQRAKSLQSEALISPEAYEQAQAAYETARAQLQAGELMVGYTEIRAPFGGLIINRYVAFAEQVSMNAPLFRISDFNPLLCPIQVPERELSRLRVGQAAYLTVEPYPGRRFDASVLRIRPVVDARTGTVKVTLEVKGQGKLRPGMFSRVFVETETRQGALVIPKAALSLESIGDVVYVAQENLASRREVELGFSEGDFVEVASGVAAGESVVVVGQDGLSDGTPIQVLEAGAPRPAAGGARAEPGPPSGPGGRGGVPPDFSKMTPEQLERAKEFMRSRGMTEEQIEERIRQARQQAQAAGE